MKWLLATGLGCCNGKDTLLAIPMGVEATSWPPIMARIFWYCSGVKGECVMPPNWG